LSTGNKIKAGFSKKKCVKDRKSGYKKEYGSKKILLYYSLSDIFIKNGLKTLLFLGKIL
jgi:hypothetical protein